MNRGSVVSATKFHVIIDTSPGHVVSIIELPDRPFRLTQYISALEIEVEWMV